MKIAVIIPIYNDWQSLKILLGKFTELDHLSYHFIIVNDGSSKSLGAIPNNATILNLKTNVGHQKAIAIGLAYARDNFGNYSGVVMDGDGEDQPGDIKKLIEHSNLFKQPSVCFAERSGRNEGWFFLVFYKLYLIFIKLLSGKSFAIGNFSYIPSSLLSSVANNPKIWTHYAGGIMSSKIPLVKTPIDKGHRIAGQSKMRFKNLVLHGLNSLAVMMNYVTVRAFVLMILLSFLLLCIVAFVLYARFVANITIQGWAAIILTGLFLISLQLFSIILILIVVQNLGNKDEQYISSESYKNYIYSVIK